MKGKKGICRENQRKEDKEIHGRDTERVVLRETEERGKSQNGSKLDPVKARDRVMQGESKELEGRRNDERVKEGRKDTTDKKSTG